MTRSTKSWVLSEFKDLSHNDKRLDKRFVKVARDALENPAAPINQASGDWAASKAAYRLYNNPKIDKAQISKVHQNNTLDRMKGYKVILAVQDTTLLDFSTHTKLKGKGPIGTKAQGLTGFVMHSTLALTTTGLPLGLITHSLWARDEIKENRNDVKEGEKESVKWINAFKTTCEVAPPNVEIIHICDREADFFEFLEIIDSLNEKCIIRSRFNRQIEDHGAMWDFMTTQPVHYTETVAVERNKLFVGGKNKKGFKVQRQAIVEVRVAHISFLPTQRAKNRKPRKFNLVYVKEINPPEGEEAVEWMLITNVSIDTKDEIARIINYYRLRWLIEEYHKILKTGCKIEDCRLEDPEAMFRYIMLYCIIAWRLFWLVRIQRINPDILCTEALTDPEWKALYCYLRKTQKLPDKTPTIREITVWIACLGGFLARKGDGEPGIISMWRGWTRLNDIVEMYAIFNSYSKGEN